MGIERDFLMRQIMLLMEVLQKILRYRKKGEKGKANDMIQVFYSALKIEEDVSQLTIEELLLFLEKKKGLNNDQLEMVAFVLKEQGELAEDETKRLDFFSKSYFILEKVDQNSATFSVERQMKLSELSEYMA